VPVSAVLVFIMLSSTPGAENVAVTVALVDDDTVHVLVPVHPPLHPANVSFPDGTAINSTDTVLLKVPTHIEPVQTTPVGLLDIVPVPEPVFTTVTSYVVEIATDVNTAVLVSSLSIVIVQVPVPVHPPPHPVNTDPAAGVAVIITDESSSNSP